MRAANRLGIDVRSWTPQIGAGADYILNIEPYRYVNGKVWTGVWEIDLLLSRGERQGSNWESANQVFTAVSTLPSGFGKYGALFLPQACDRDFIREPTDDVDFVIACSMQSPPYEKRVHAYDKLQAKYTYDVFGTNHKPEEYIKGISRAKVQFVRSMNTDVADGELAQRFFECLGIGPVLTNWCKDLEYLDLVEGEDYYSYKNDTEMIEKMDKLLNDDTFRHQMAENGRRKALLNHTYENRLISILNYAKPE